MRKCLVCRVDFCQYLFGNLDSIGIGLLAYGNPNAALTVNPNNSLEFFIGILDFRDLAERYSGAVLFHNNSVANLVKIDEFCRSAEGHLEAALFDFTGRQVKVGVTNRLQHLVQRKTQGIYPVRVQFDADLPVKPSPDIDLSHPGNAGKTVTDLIFDQLRQFHGIKTT